MKLVSFVKLFINALTIMKKFTGLGEIIRILQQTIECLQSSMRGLQKKMRGLRVPMIGKYASLEDNILIN